MKTITFTWITTASWKQTCINQSSPGIQRKIFVQIFFTYEGFIPQFCKAFHRKMKYHSYCHFRPFPDKTNDNSVQKTFKP